jgi:hypothetical protein
MVLGVGKERLTVVNLGERWRSDLALLCLQVSFSSNGSTQEQERGGPACLLKYPHHHHHHYHASLFLAMQQQYYCETK